MPIGEIICDACGRYESECVCRAKNKGETEQELRNKIATAFKVAREEGVIHRFADGVADADEVIHWFKEALPAIAKEWGWINPEEVIMPSGFGTPKPRRGVSRTGYG